MPWRDGVLRKKGKKFEEGKKKKKKMMVSSFIFVPLLFFLLDFKTSMNRTRSVRRTFPTYWTEIVQVFFLSSIVEKSPPDVPVWFPGVQTKENIKKIGVLCLKISSSLRSVTFFMRTFLVLDALKTVAQMGAKIFPRSLYLVSRTFSCFFAAFLSISFFSLFILFLLANAFFVQQVKHNRYCVVIVIWTLG